MSKQIFGEYESKRFVWQGIGWYREYLDWTNTLECEMSIDASEEKRICHFSQEKKRNRKSGNFGRCCKALLLFVFFTNIRRALRFPLEIKHFCLTQK